MKLPKTNSFTGLSERATDKNEYTQSEKSVAENVLKWGTGGLNIDGCRIEGAYGTGQNEIIEGKQSGVMYHN